MDLEIKGRKALIFGASRGLGHACALAVAREGVEVTVVARTKSAIEAAAKAIADETGVKAIPVAADLRTPEGRAAALAACPAPDILLNNADGPEPGDFRDWTREDWHGAFDSMTLGPIEMIRATVDGMMDRGFGRIVNISSRSVKIAQSEIGLSNAARSALVGFTAGLARQTVSRGVTINNLLAGIFDSGAQKRHIEGMLPGLGKTFDQVWTERAAGSPAKRFGDPSEFGAYFAFLCSAKAGYINAQNLLIDGGAYPGTY